MTVRVELSASFVKQMPVQNLKEVQDELRNDENSNENLNSGLPYTISNKIKPDEEKWHMVFSVGKLGNLKTEMA